MVRLQPLDLELNENKEKKPLLEQGLITLLPSGPYLSLPVYNQSTSFTDSKNFP